MNIIKKLRNAWKNQIPEQIFPIFVITTLFVGFAPYFILNVLSFYCIKSPVNNLPFLGTICGILMTCFLFAFGFYCLLRFMIDKILLSQNNVHGSLNTIFAIASLLIPGAPCLIAWKMAKNKNWKQALNMTIFAILSACYSILILLSITIELNIIQEKNTVSILIHSAIFVLMIIFPLTAITCYGKMIGLKLSHEQKIYSATALILSLISYGIGISHVLQADQIWKKITDLRKNYALFSEQKEIEAFYSSLNSNPEKDLLFEKIHNIIEKLDQNPALREEKTMKGKRNKAFFEEFRKQAGPTIQKMLSFKNQITLEKNGNSLRFSSVQYIIKMKIPFKNTLMTASQQRLSSLHLIMYEYQIPKLDQEFSQKNLENFVRTLNESADLSLAAAWYPDSTGYIIALDMEKIRLKYFSKMINSGKFSREQLQKTAENILATGRIITDKCRFFNALCTSVKYADYINREFLETSDPEMPQIRKYKFLYPQIYYFVKMGINYHLKESMKYLLMMQKDAWQIKTFFEKNRKKSSANPPAYALLADSIIWEYYIKNDFAHRLDCMEIAFAAEKFRLKFGSYPKTLDKVSGMFLENLPIDTWNNKKYQIKSGKIRKYDSKEEHNGFMVYSPLDLTAEEINKNSGVYHAKGIYRINLSPDKKVNLPAFAIFPGLQ